MIVQQLPLFPRCRECQQPTTHATRLCSACYAAKPVDTQGRVLTAAIAPHNWRDIPPWCDDFRVVNGVRVRSAGPLYYQDADGAVWKLKRDSLEWEYERWEESQ